MGRSPKPDRRKKKWRGQTAKSKAENGVEEQHMEIATQVGSYYYFSELYIFCGVNRGLIVFSNDYSLE